MKNKIKLILICCFGIAVACLSVYMDMYNEQKPKEQVLSGSILKEPDMSSKFSVLTKDGVSLDVNILHVNERVTEFSVYCPTTQSYIQIKNTDKISVSAYNQVSYFIALRKVLRGYFSQYALEELTRTNCPVTNII